MVRLIMMLLPTLMLLQVLQGPSTVEGYTYSRADFPSDFIFGSGSSAYQVEGAESEDGRTPSIVDMLNPSDGSTGEVACDEYHKYKEDVQLMADTGLDAYRFSISWSRLLPNGRGPVNPKGVEYYSNLINELLSHGIQPHVTLLHFDLPLAINEYGGWYNKQIIKDFTAYSDVCFREFGNRVSHWTTINEPNVWSSLGSAEPYIATHNKLLAHASVVRLYKNKYQGKQHGYVGINVYALSFLPATDAKEDLLAARRGYDFMVGWYMEPLMFGDYPDIMKQSVGNRLPSFTDHESELVKNSYDFIGVNCYSYVLVKDNPSSLERDVRDYFADMALEWGAVNVGGAIIQDIMEYFKRVYGNPPIFIHENGYQMHRNASLNDTPRIEFLNASIGSLLHAVRNGSNVRGYFQWSFLDLFEFLEGYEWGYGLYNVDRDDPKLTRYPKMSAHWYSSFLKGRSSDLISGSEIIQQVTNFTITPLKSYV